MKQHSNFYTFLFGVYVNPLFSLNYANLLYNIKNANICIYFDSCRFIEIKSERTCFYSVQKKKMPLNHIIFDNKFTAANIEIDVPTTLAYRKKMMRIGKYFSSKLEI